MPAGVWRWSDDGGMSLSGDVVRRSAAVTTFFCAGLSRLWPAVFSLPSTTAVAMGAATTVAEVALCVMAGNALWLSVAASTDTWLSLFSHA